MPKNKRRRGRRGGSLSPASLSPEIRKQRLLGIQVPQALGGDGGSIAEIADVCYILGQACSSTGLIYAMHQIKMACMVRHAKGNAAIERILGRIAADQLLMASSTTEGQAGGNVRSSEAAVEHDGDQVTLERKATVISYAVEAGRHSHHRAPRGRRGGLRPSAVGAAEGRLHPRALAGMGHARYARNA